jgi:hypothetical protein
VSPETSRRKRDRLIMGMGAVCLICLAITIGVSYTTLHNRSDLIDVQQGRVIGSAVSCGATSAIIEAGRQTIAGPGRADPKTEPVLRSLGFPPFKVRKKQAELEAARYALAISRSIERQSHVRGLVRPDGSLDCRKLKIVSKVDQ